MTDEKTKRLAVKSACLEGRIQENASAQATDFNAWIFDHIPIKEGDTVLELCCGTGAQTEFFLQRVGERGAVIALDISADSLEILKTRIRPEHNGRLTLIESDIDMFNESLLKRKLSKKHFDIIFCSYGLYYSKNASQLLEQAKGWLKADGSLVIVGPFGPNNEPLFSLLCECGVTISDYVRFTSQDFMQKDVIPFGIQNFKAISIKILKNTITWKSPESVLSYWKNTTFFEPDKSGYVQQNLQDHFSKNGVFINEKWVMLVIMNNE